MVVTKGVTVEEVLFPSVTLESIKIRNKYIISDGEGRQAGMVGELNAYADLLSSRSTVIKGQGNTKTEKNVRINNDEAKK